MAFAGIDIIDFSGFSGYLIVRWKRRSSPLTEVGRSNAMPFPVSEKVIAEDLDPVVYDFEFWQSANGTDLDTLLETWPIDAGAYSGGVVTQLEYVTDRGSAETDGTKPFWSDPVALDTMITDHRLSGASKGDLSVEIEGRGTIKSFEWDLRSDGTPGIDLKGYQLGNAQGVFVKWYQRVSGGSSTGTSTPTTGSAVGVVEIGADMPFDTSHKNKTLYCTASAAVTTYSLPAINTMADCTLTFSTQGMSGISLRIQLASGDLASFEGRQQNWIDLGKAETCTLVIKSNKLYVVGELTGYKRLGRRELVDKLGVNQLPANGTILPINQFQRIAGWISGLPVTQVHGDKTTWLTTEATKHKYYYNEALGECGLPDDRGMHYRALSAGSADNERLGADGVAGSDTSNVPGAYQWDSLKSHNHDLPVGDLTGVPNGSTPRRRGLYNGDGGTGSVDASYDAGGPETRGKNVGLMAVVNI